MDESARAARNADLRLAAVVLRVEDDDEDRAAGLKRLAGDLLFRRHHTFRPPEVHVDDAGLDPVHDPAGELAPMLGDVAQDFVALEIVDVSQHGVLCRLGGHALEVFRRKLGDDGGAVRTDDSASHVERPGLSIEFDRHLARRVEGARVSRRERAFDRVQHLLEGDAHLCAKRGQRFGQRLRGRFRLRPRACPRQRHPTLYE